MQKKSKVINFPVASSFDANNHSLSQGGMTMKIKHTHPEYADEAERLERLQELKKVFVQFKWILRFQVLIKILLKKLLLKLIRVEKKLD